MRLTGLEPALISEAAPKTAVSANFTTGAYLISGGQICGLAYTQGISNVGTLPKTAVSANFTTGAYLISGGQICGLAYTQGISNVGTLPKSGASANSAIPAGCFIIIAQLSPFVKFSSPCRRDRRPDLQLPRRELCPVPCTSSPSRGAWCRPQRQGRVFPPCPLP